MSSTAGAGRPTPSAPGDALADVTVVIPTKNRRALLARTLHAVLHQQDVDIDVVVVDDGSTDGTADTVMSLGDDRVSVVRHEATRGVSTARNAGMARATAPWIALMDDDDVWAPTKLRAQLDALRASPGATWSCVGLVYIDERCRVISRAPVPPGPDVADLLLQYNAVPGGGSGVLASRELVAQIGGYDEALAACEDWDFHIRLALAGRLAPVEAFQLGYYRHRQGGAHDVARSRTAYDYVRLKHDRERKARGVQLDEFARLDYLGNMWHRAGRRWLGLATHTELAWTDRRRRSIVALAKGPVPHAVRDGYGRWKVRRSMAGNPGEFDWLAPYVSGWLEPAVIEAGGNYSWRR